MQRLEAVVAETGGAVGRDATSGVGIEGVQHENLLLVYLYIKLLEEKRTH